MRTTGLKAKLVDRLEYEDEFTERVKNHGGSSHKEVDYTDYARAEPVLHIGSGRSNRGDLRRRRDPARRRGLQIRSRVPTRPR